MAKPRWKPGSVEPAVTMPRTRFWLFSSGPPEYPGTTGASVAITLFSVSESPLSSFATICWWRAMIRPRAAFGGPPRPCAFPRATTGIPTRSGTAPPSLIVFPGPQAFANCRTATSCETE